jgi:polysaccharide biosynthesis/export protein
MYPTLKATLKHLLTLVFLVILISSCIPNKKLIYFPDPNFNYQNLTEIENIPTVYRLQPRDIVSVNIKTLDEETSNYFNLTPSGPLMGFTPSMGFMMGHSINKEGEIRLPETGKIKIGGLTVDEAQEEIEKALSQFIANPSIEVKLISFKVTVLGEVENPGHYYIYNEQSTVLECLGLAGDLTDFGNRENITLIRQSAVGPGATLINLKDPQFLSSPYYYVQPNDVIYVQPMRAKATRNNLTTLHVLSVVAGVISTGILVLNFLGY